MNLHLKIKDYQALLIILISLPIIVVIGLWLSSLHPGFGDHREVDEWMDSIREDWNDFKARNPEFEEFDIKVTSLPSLSINEEIEKRIDMTPLEDVMHGFEPPVDLSVDVIIRKGDEILGVYDWRYPDSHRGRWIMHDEQSANPVE